MNNATFLRLVGAILFTGFGVAFSIKGVLEPDGWTLTMPFLDGMIAGVLIKGATS